MGSSGGSITLNSSDPFDKPLINPNLLAEEVDIVVIREAIRASRRFLSAPAWDGYIIAAQENATTDDELDALIRNTSRTVDHPVSTAMMSPYNATWGVVDPDLKVKGVKGLRIVDASVFVST